MITYSDIRAGTYVYEGAVDISCKGFVVYDKAWQEGCGWYISDIKGNILQLKWVIDCFSRTMTIQEFNNGFNNVKRLKR